MSQVATIASQYHIPDPPKQETTAHNIGFLGPDITNTMMRTRMIEPIEMPNYNELGLRDGVPLYVSPQIRPSENYDHEGPGSLWDSSADAVTVREMDSSSDPSRCNSDLMS